MNNTVSFRKEGNYRFIIPRHDRMRVDGLIFADDRMIEEITRDNAHQQVINVASLPGIQKNAMAMPDIHYGYGFPIGGVAAFDIEEGIISPGGIGYDINCGVRLLTTGINASDLDEGLAGELANGFYNDIPSGVGSTGKIKISAREVKKVLSGGARWAVDNGYGSEEDLEYCEESGCLEGADTGTVSDRALERGRQQIGTLGAGNHFLEIQKVEEVYDREAAEAFGIYKGKLTVMIHTGSRGLGYQICDDYIKKMQQAVMKYGIELTDRQLVCAPFMTSEAQDYFMAMKCGANYAWANRQCITHWVRETLSGILKDSSPVRLMYDVCHNVGKVEEHEGKKLIVHRKGATRSFGPGRKEIPAKYRAVGQPVIVPGTMGTASFIMKGTKEAMKESFGSTCHGAGRVWSRTRAKKTLRGDEVISYLKNRGITVRAKSYKTVAEEAPQAYKKIEDVTEICHNAGLSKKVARLVPVAVVKG